MIKKKIIEYLSSLNASIGKYAIYGETDYNYSEYEYVITKKVILNYLVIVMKKYIIKTNEPMYIVGLQVVIKKKLI
ncbi:MAG: hypothetical protein L6V81_02960 [Clostridium sp.]|nr:MAG: hypothetical protein L6V81_02960 [Clostridium sp.]